MRIPILVTRALEDVREKRQPRPDRDDDNDGPGSGQGKSLIVAVVFVAVLLFSLFIYVSLRILRRTRPEPPRWLPQFVKEWWTKWRPGTYIPTPVSENAATAASSMSSRTSERSANRDSNRDRHRNRDRDRERRRREAPGQGIDRNTSIRSIMTLPEYRPVAAPGKERTIGREGERAGIDVVLEFPESATEEEQRREEHMQALYEIRLARQLERAEARESAAGGSRRSRHGSSPAGRDRGRTRDGSSSTSLAAALAAVTERDRRLSNVAYAEVGLARPDGSRIRASSTASERDNQPLLSSGASMGHTRSVSIESVEMFSARPSMETRPRGGSDSRQVSGSQVRSMLDVGREPSPPPPDYGGPPLEPPPGYDQLHDIHEGQHGNMNIQVPLLRVESASPEPPRLPTYPAQVR